MINIKKYSDNIKEYTGNIKYYIVLFLVSLLPYWGFRDIFQHFSVVLFILVILSGQLSIKNLFTNKVIVVLVLFFIFASISFFWSNTFPTVTIEFKNNIHNYKYYLMLLISIYSLSLTKKEINNIFFIMAISPLGISIIYYLNSFGITHLYSTLFFHGNTDIITHYLMNNFFILYSAIYFYIQLYEKFIQKEYKLSLVSLLMTILIFISMFIDSKSTARLTIVAFFFILPIVPLFYFKKKYSILLILFSLLFAVFFMTNNQKMSMGINKITTAIENDQYTGSWGHRLGFAIVGLKIFTENPVIGRGICDVRERTILFAKENPKFFIHDHNRHFHNEHINILVQVGVVGYFIFLIFIFYFIKTKINNHFLNTLKYIFITSFFVMMLGEQYISNIKQTGLFFIIFIALILLYNKQEKALLSL